MVATTRPWNLTLDCVSPSVVAAFWKAALGYVDAPPPEGFMTWREWLIHCEVPESEWDNGASIVDPAGVAPKLSLLKVPEGKQLKNRLHLDLQVSGGRAEPPQLRASRLRAEARRLVDAGARVIHEHLLRGDLDHVVLADPEGNELCIV